jgi:photoactive yellow protein
MSDPATDLYSFLRSKDFTSGNQETEDASTNDATDEEDGASSQGETSAPSPGLRSVDDFSDNADASSGIQQQEAATSSTDEPTSLHFDDENVGEKLRNCSPSTLNEASFGIIKVSDSGTVEFFNKYESELSGVDPSAAEGQDFFTELAPCSNNRLFRGRFQKGIRKGELDEKFEYTYTYKMRPTLVDVRLYRDSAGNNWIMVHKR